MSDGLPKVIIVGVGNSGTSLLGELINELLAKHGYPIYHYEPLYWSGNQGKKNNSINPKSISEHTSFPLLADDFIETWPWMDDFIDNLVGLAKFIRAGSRVRFIQKHPVKIIWITRELYSYLGSMQKNFPRCLPDGGWHHRPGEYDDFERLQAIYSDFDLRPEEKFRIEVEAAWWHLHNSEVMKACENGSIYWVRYEDLSKNPVDNMIKISKFIGVPFTKTKGLKTVHAISERNIMLSPRNVWVVDAIAGGLNKTMYSNS